MQTLILADVGSRDGLGVVSFQVREDDGTGHRFTVNLPKEMIGTTILIERQAIPQYKSLGGQ